VEDMTLIFPVFFTNISKVYSYMKTKNHFVEPILPVYILKYKNKIYLARNFRFSWAALYCSIFLLMPLSYSQKKSIENSPITIKVQEIS
jgi:hypothetical protein